MLSGGGREKTALPDAKTSSGSVCPERDSNPHDRNGQGILSPSCLPFHHPGGCARAKIRRKARLAKRHASVLHEEDIGSRCVGGTITKKMGVAPPVIGDFERYSTIGQIVGARTTSANDVFGLIGNGREPSLNVVVVVADGANGIVRHNGKGAIEGRHRRDTDKETGDALRTPVGFERCARQGRSGASSQSGEQILSGIVGDETPRTGVAHGAAEGGRSTDRGEAQESGQRGKTALRVVAARGECAHSVSSAMKRPSRRNRSARNADERARCSPGKRAFEQRR